jgi:superfamily II RNA helicase
MSKYLKILDHEYEGDFTSEPCEFSFELDSFQKHAINAIQKNENVLITAHTGSGKTVPAIYGIADSLKKNKKIIYTSPIKSLSNQKLFELKSKFPDIGILTGDIKFNPDAQCVIMTTEILRNILYQKESQYISIDEVDKVIFDEIHYINDPDRGKVWEECLILLPKNIILIMLSATIDKAHEFAGWIGDIKEKITNLIPTNKRVVPLEHFFYINEELVKIVDHKGVIMNYSKIKKEYNVISCFKMVNQFVYYLQSHNLVPALFFIFSRKECEKLANCIQRSLVTSEESAEIAKIFDFELRHYKKIYDKSPQYHEILRLAKKGITYHHSGLIPILKEVIEILFAKGLIKVLFATETFAVGVNMPAKTVIFPKLTKYSNNNFRYLRTDEYLQMAGRAGRRGLDKFGHVIILPNDDLMEYTAIKSMMTGKSPCISSKFKLSYQFLLKIMSNDTFKLEDFMNQSLFNQDNSFDIKSYIKEKKELESNLSLDLSESDTKIITDYMQQYEVISRMKGNQKKKESAKLNKIRNGIRNFDKIQKKYKEYDNQKLRILKLTQNIEYLKTFVHEDSQKMIKYLQDNHYLDGMTILIKGIIAREISECNEIIIAEILNKKLLDNLELSEIVAVVAAFIEEKNNDITQIRQLKITEPVIEVLEHINYIASDFGDYEYQSGIEIGTDWNLYLSFIGPAYDWAKGDSIYEIYSKYDNIYEGNFIRNILRINNILENIKNISETTQNTVLLKKLESINDIIIRDQVTTESLYINKK